MIYTLFFSLCFSSPHSQVGYRHISSITIALRGEEGYGRSRGWWGAATELWRRGDYGALRIVSPLPTKWLPRAASGQSWSLFFFICLAPQWQWLFPNMIFICQVLMWYCWCIWLLIQSVIDLKSLMWCRQVRWLKANIGAFNHRKWPFLLAISI